MAQQGISHRITAAQCNLTDMRHHWIMDMEI